MSVHLVYVLFAHFIGDFLAQTDRMAQNKSRSFGWLSIHVLTYTAVLAACLGVLGSPPLSGIVLYSVLNGAAHFVTDAVTSRVTSRLWKANERHWFFVVIGFDQFLHAAVLLWTATLLLQEVP